MPRLSSIELKRNFSFANSSNFSVVRFLFATKTASDASEYNQSQTSITPRLAVVKLNAKGEIYYIDTDAISYENDPRLATTVSSSSTENEAMEHKRILDGTDFDTLRENSRFQAVYRTLSQNAKS